MGNEFFAELSRRLNIDGIESSAIDVHYFTRVADALDSFMKHRYCLVIMDISVEGADGRELLQTIFQAKHVPILVITEDLNPDKGMKLLDAGATVCIRKPFALCRVFLFGFRRPEGGSTLRHLNTRVKRIRPAPRFWAKGPKCLYGA